MRTAAAISRAVRCPTLRCRRSSGRRACAATSLVAALRGVARAGSRSGVRPTVAAVPTIRCGAHTQAHDHTGRRRQSSVCSNESATPASFDLAQVGSSALCRRTAALALVRAAVAPLHRSKRCRAAEGLDDRVHVRYRLSRRRHPLHTDLIGNGPKPDSGVRGNRAYAGIGRTRELGVRWSSGRGAAL
jgi:hypothetical protein